MQSNSEDMRHVAEMTSSVPAMGIDGNSGTLTLGVAVNVPRAVVGNQDREAIGVVVVVVVSLHRL